MRVPLATYRVQLGPDLTFDDVAALLPYLQDLGVSDCYTSPFFETSSTGSHGYDVNDHNQLRAELEASRPSVAWPRRWGSGDSAC